MDLATELVRGCVVADIMFLRARRTTTPVSSDPLAVALDELQQQEGEGPCLAAARGMPLVVTNDLASDERWPAFGTRATELAEEIARTGEIPAAATGDRTVALHDVALDAHPRLGDLRDRVAEQVLGARPRDLLDVVDQPADEGRTTWSTRIRGGPRIGAGTRGPVGTSHRRTTRRT